MVKVKYRVFVTKYCNGTSWPCDDKKKACKTKHEFPTHRYEFTQSSMDFEGTVEEAIQQGYAKLVRMLDAENRRDKDKKRQQRPWFQYVVVK